MDFAKLTQALKETKGKTSMPPVDQWHPPFCGNMDLIIKSNGQWLHEGTPFTRPALVKLFASVLKKEDDEYFLVTPVEKIGITVEDVPFVVVDWQQVGNNIEVTTSVGESFLINDERNDEHTVELRSFADTTLPYVKVRRNLWARLNQNVYYQWIELASSTQNSQAAHGQLSLNSGQYNFVIGNY